jgi:hypothetical protein
MKSTNLSKHTSRPLAASHCYGQFATELRVLMSTVQKKSSTEKSREQVVQRKSFGRPPESVVESCRARMCHPIANVSETSRQQAKVSTSKKFKKASLIF